MATPTQPATDPAQPAIPPDLHGKRCRMKNETRSHLAFVTKTYDGELAGYFDLLVFLHDPASGFSAGILQTIHEDEISAMEA